LYINGIILRNSDVHQVNSEF